MRPTVMKISLKTLESNARALRARLPERVKMLCVVKADAYGHGAVPLARRLHGLADAFAVAVVEEAKALRDGGVQEMIVILGGGEESSLREAVRLGASQAVYLPQMLEVLEDEAARLGCMARAHLKLDTGMSRIGVRDEQALSELLAKWKTCPHVTMEGCFTHFCVADSDPAFTRLQNERFEAMINCVRDAGFSPIAHAAASTAMLSEDYWHDMVRAGIALYGGCMPQMGDALSYAQTLTTRPVRIETIDPGDTVGYGRTFRAERVTRIMTLPIGYGDGYPRILSNHADVLVRGRRAPIVGNVCMDMIMADVTDIDGVTMEDEVVLLGAQDTQRITPDELAQRAQTIPYEIMLGFSPRVPRIYVDE